MAVEVQIAIPSDDIPDSIVNNIDKLGLTSDLEVQRDQWVACVLQHVQKPEMDMTIRIVDEHEITDLNHRYRGKDKPTNVLAFPGEEISEINYSYLGDVIICLDVLTREAIQENKHLENHFAHLVVHGTLHLCGLDHQHDEEANIMETAEKNILRRIGLTLL